MSIKYLTMLFTDAERALQFERSKKLCKRIGIQYDQLNVVYERYPFILVAVEKSEEIEGWIVVGHLPAHFVPFEPGMDWLDAMVDSAYMLRNWGLKYCSKWDYLPDTDLYWNVDEDPVRECSNQRVEDTNVPGTFLIFHILKDEAQQHPVLQKNVQRLLRLGGCHFAFLPGSGIDPSMQQ